METEAEGYTSNDLLLIDGSTELPDTIPKFVMTTYDSLRNKQIFSWLNTRTFRTLVCDEVHSVKRWKAKRTKQTVKLSRSIPYRILLTGTPVTNKAIEDVFTLGLLIDDGTTFGRDWFGFMKRYFTRPNPRMGWFPKRESYDLVRRKLATVALHVHEDDSGVLKLPPIRWVVKGVKMSGMQLKYYRQALDDWELRIPGADEPYEMRYAVERITKLKQIASGFFYDNTEQHKVFELRSEKFKVVENTLLEDFAHKPKIVVWCAFIPEIRRVVDIAKKNGISYVTFFGNSQKHRDEARRKFKNDPKVRLFIAQADRGVGMNELIVADTAFYVSNSPRVVSREQSLRRIRRIGSEIHKAITYVDFLTENTVDQEHYEALKAKQNLATWILQKSKHEGVARFLSHRLSG